MTRPEEALAIHETDTYRSSTFARLEDGRILQLAGTNFTTSDDGGITWSEPFERRDPNGDLVGGLWMSLVRLSGNGVGVSTGGTGFGLDSPHDLPGTQFQMFWRSEDGGETWEAPVRISLPGIDACQYQDVLIRTSSGRIVMPVYTRFGQSSGPGGIEPPHSGKLVHGQWASSRTHFWDPGFRGSLVYYSGDDGRTWQRNRDGELIILLDWNADFNYTNEPSVTEVEPAKLLMFLRTALGRLFQSWSTDNGETWTRPAPTALASSIAPGQIRTLPNGHLLAVWNQHSEDEIKQGFVRTRISSAISRDGGSVWEFFQNVESIHEETRVEPGPIRPVRPEEYHFRPGVPAPEREGRYITPAEDYGWWTYPSVFVMDDRVLIGHRYRAYREHPTQAKLLTSSETEGSGGFIHKLKVLPLSWFYGGKEPAESVWIAQKEIPV